MFVLITPVYKMSRDTIGTKSARVKSILLDKSSTTLQMLIDPSIVYIGAQYQSDLSLE